MKLCLVGQTIWTLPERVTGGAERQVALLAEYMAARGHEVTCVVPGWKGAPQVISGVQLLSGWNCDMGGRGLRWLTYRLPNLRRVLRKVNADVYYCRGFSKFAPTVVAAAQSLNAQAWIGLAHDTDFNHYLRLGSGGSNIFGRWSDRYLASYYFLHFGLKRANCVIAQHDAQLKRCHIEGINAKIIRNILPLTDIGKIQPHEPSADVVWVGSLSRKKGLAKLDEIASILSDVSFEIIGPKVDTILNPLLDQLLSRKNVTWSGELPHEKVLERMACAKILLNTSPQEGFANTMLEAWALGKPVLSVASDPDGLLSGKLALGECGRGDVTALVAAIRLWLSDEPMRKKVGANAMQYVRDHHSPDSVCAAYEQLLYRLEGDIS